MSSETNASPTVTPDKALPPPSQTAQPSKPPKPPKPTDARPLDASSVFGGKVADTVNATKRATPPAAEVVDADFTPNEEPAAKKRGRPKKGEKEPVVVTDKHTNAAAATVRMLEGLPKVVASRRYSTVFSERQLADIDAALSYSDAERHQLIAPLAQGYAEHGLELPWWLEFAAAGLLITVPRFAMFGEFEKMADAEWERQGKGTPAPVKGEP